MYDTARGGTRRSSARCCVLLPLNWELASSRTWVVLALVCVCIFATGTPDRSRSFLIIDTSYQIINPSYQKLPSGSGDVFDAARSSEALCSINSFFFFVLVFVYAQQLMLFDAAINGAERNAFSCVFYVESTAVAFCPCFLCHWCRGAIASRVSFLPHGIAEALARSLLFFFLTSPV